MVCVGDIPFPEQCNGLDDDCDGELDEEWPKKGEVCGISPLCGIVHWGCNAAKTGLACNLLPVQEQCDGKDNDCDGYTDEGYLDMNKNGIADCIE